MFKLSAQRARFLLEGMELATHCVLTMPAPALPFRVTVCDDDRRMCALISDYLHARGHTCEWLDDPFQLIAYLRLNPCDAVILDIDMPGMSGLELLPQVRAAFPGLPVLMFTGAGFDESKMQGALHGGAKASGPNGRSGG